MADRSFGFPPVKKRVPPQVQSSFDEFDATELYCAQCRRAVPVRKSLLLVLPEGDKYEYRCQVCGTTVGDKLDKNGQFYA
jgi:hypothetical protein